MDKQGKNYCSPSNQPFVNMCIEEITNKIDQMNMEFSTNDSNQMNPDPGILNNSLVMANECDQTSFSANMISENQEQYYNLNPEAAMETNDNSTFDDEMNMGQPQEDDSSRLESMINNILIVTNVDLSIFHDNILKSKFESLFLAYDHQVQFRYLKSFRRVRLDFSNRQAAASALVNLNRYRLGNTEFTCYPVQEIKAGSNNNNDSNQNTSHLAIPKLTKQFLISPPASPPIGWKPVDEGSPCIDVQLISAIANLVPGKIHEIHAGNESQPGIFVEVCEEAQFPTKNRRTCSRTIPKTATPLMNCSLPVNR